MMIADISQECTKRVVVGTNDYGVICSIVLGHAFVHAAKRKVYDILVCFVWALCRLYEGMPFVRS